MRYRSRVFDRIGFGNVDRHRRGGAQEPPIRIGLIDMYNGPFAYQTAQIRVGFQIAIDEANAAGGVKGRNFELQTADMGLSVEKAITEARRMISNENIHYVVVGSHAGAALAIGGLIKGRDDVFLLGGVATSKHFTAEVGGPMIGRSNWSTVELGRIMAANLKSKQEIKRIATIAPDFEFGHDFVDDIVAAIKEVRPDIVIARQEWPKIGTLDFAPQVSAIQAAKPDMVVSGIFGGDLVNFLKAAKGFGLFDGGKVTFFTHGLDQVKMAFAKRLCQRERSSIFGIHITQSTHRRTRSSSLKSRSVPRSIPSAHTGRLYSRQDAHQRNC